MCCRNLQSEISRKHHVAVQFLQCPIPPKVCGEGFEVPEVQNSSSQADEKRDLILFRVLLQWLCYVRCHDVTEDFRLQPMATAANI